MTLLEAFRLLGPNEGDAADARRNDASRVVWDELQRLARQLTFSEEIREEAAMRVALNMIDGGAQSESARECEADVNVTRFLRRCLKNMAITLWRQAKARAEDPLEVPDRESTFADLTLAIDEELGEEDLEAAARRIDERFHAEVVPACEATLRPSARADFRQSVAHMRALVFEQVTIEDVVREATGRSGKAAEDSVYQRHSRTRDRLLAFVRARQQDGTYSAEQARQYRGCVSFLQRRASSAKEAARAAQRDQP